VGRLTATRRRLRENGGFGLIELLIAMMVMTVALFAFLAAFTVGISTLRRSGSIATASALASSQLDLYRALTYAAITLDATSVAATDSAIPGGTGSEVTSSCAGVPAQCNPSRTVTGADHATYRIDTYIVATTPTGGRADKLVTVVVRNPSNLASYYVRRVLVFDSATG
jgi:Tfp pilus assembly protein PilV